MTFRLHPWVHVWSSHHHEPCGCQGHLAMEKGCRNAWGECKSWARTSVLCSSGVITRTLYLGQTRCFLKMTNHLPKFSWALDGLTSTPVFYFPKPDRPLWSSTSPCTILTSIAHVPAFPCSYLAVRYQRGKGGSVNTLAEHNAVVPCSVKLQLPGEANRLMLPSLLSSMSSSLCCFPVNN